jgi:hypothetical protein
MTKKGLQGVVKNSRIYFTIGPPDMTIFNVFQKAKQINVSQSAPFGE